MINQQKGFGVLEIVFTLGVISIFIVSIGKLTSSVDKANDISKAQTKAQLYTQEAIEIINDIKNNNNVFACDCNSGDTCVVDVDCTRSTGDNKICNLFEGYNRCWTEYPHGLDGATYYYMDDSGGSWELKEDVSADSKVAIVGNFNFFRRIAIENICRDTSDDDKITACPGSYTDFNTKQITVTVWYTVRDTERKVETKILLTAWENS